MPKGFANLDVAEIDAARVGYCHPQQSKRTKCRCGKVVQLGKTGSGCTCGRVHRKAPGAAFASTGAQAVRPGGRAGCPGVK
jgi:hypothetical protein